MEEDFGLYLHWPYCASKCPYCDFNSHVVEGPPEVLWRRALATEITALAAALPGQKISSVFFGGGTPSLMAADTVGEVLAAVARHFSLTADCEITLEANPSSAEAAKLRDFRAAGV
ncbi:MAG: radical SAM protein, partial [Pseudomonadota bacterium]|nr:radical SAM protein [Pseudomonadota bacterium]